MPPVPGDAFYISIGAAISFVGFLFTVLGLIFWFVPRKKAKGESSESISQALLSAKSGNGFCKDHLIYATDMATVKTCVENVETGMKRMEENQQRIEEKVEEGQKKLHARLDALIDKFVQVH